MCVVSFLKFHYNDLLPTCCDLLAVSLASPGKRVQWILGTDKYTLIQCMNAVQQYQVLIKFPDFSRCLRHTGNSIQTGLDVLVCEQESTWQHGSRCEHFVNSK